MRSRNSKSQDSLADSFKDSNSGLSLAAIEKPVLHHRGRRDEARESAKSGAAPRNSQ